MAIGSGKVLDNGQKLPVEVKVGDRIIFSKYAGTEVKIDGDEYVIFSERDRLKSRRCAPWPAEWSRSNS